MKVRRYKLLIINFKTLAGKESSGVLKHDQKEEKLEFKIFGEERELPSPPIEALRGSLKKSGLFGGRGEYLILGTYDDQNYFYVTPKKNSEEDKAQIQLISETLDKRIQFYVSRKKDQLARYSSQKNWEKLLTLGGPVLVGILIFVAFVLFIEKGLPQMKSLAQAAASACKCTCEFVVNNTKPFV